MTTTIYGQVKTAGFDELTLLAAELKAKVDEVNEILKRMEAVRLDVTFQPGASNPEDKKVE